MFVLVLHISVLIHELAHAAATYWRGGRILQLCVGSGRPFIRFNFFSVEVELRPIPGAGYVLIPGTGIEDSDFCARNPADSNLVWPLTTNWDLLWVILAGPAANLLLAILSFYFLRIDNFFLIINALLCVTAISTSPDCDLMIASKAIQAIRKVGY